MSIPRIVIAGTLSGVGKTSLAIGLVSALKRRGLRVQTFKVGPDYLDPTYLSIASGRPCYNLDGWMMGETYVRELFARASCNVDIAVIEGVMGLFDGADPETLEGSTAEIAQWLDAPILLVANAHGAGRSFAAMVHGYASFISENRVTGVIANRVGSARHADWLKASLNSASLPPLVGAIQRGALPELPSRHLGLVTADANVFSSDILNQLADAVEAGVSLDAVLQGAKCGHSLPFSLQNIPKKFPKTVRLGVARDEAFHFYYPDNLDALERAGCELVYFSPLHDCALPADLDGIYIGGGYPELHARNLSQNTEMLKSIQCFAEGNRVIYGECGGLMYLSQGIEMLDGPRHGMVGLIPAWTRMCSSRKSLGYVEVVLNQDSLWGNCGSQLRGHEFHYSELTGTPSDCAPVYSMQYRRAIAPVAEGFQRDSVLASYAHLHFASRPGAVAHFVKRMKTSKS